jgi:hypothetical protein
MEANGYVSLEYLANQTFNTEMRTNTHVWTEQMDRFHALAIELYSKFFSHDPACVLNYLTVCMHGLLTPAIFYSLLYFVLQIGRPVANRLSPVVRQLSSKEIKCENRCFLFAAVSSWSSEGSCVLSLPPLSTTFNGCSRPARGSCLFAGQRINLDSFFCFDVL